MADLIKKIKIKKQDGTFTDYIPIGAEAQNVDTSDGDSVQLKLNKKPYYYNTVADMKADLKLKSGDMAVTLGYYENNDGGAAEYRIVSGTHTDDGGSYHQLNNSLFAELIYKENIANIKQFGAKGNGIIDDAPFIRSAIAFLKTKNGGTLYVPEGEYYLNSGDPRGPSGSGIFSNNDYYTCFELINNLTVKGDSNSKSILKYNSNRLGYNLSTNRGDVGQIFSNTRVINPSFNADPYLVEGTIYFHDFKVIYTDLAEGEKNNRDYFDGQLIRVSSIKNDTTKFHGDFIFENLIVENACGSQIFYVGRSNNFTANNCIVKNMGYAVNSASADHSSFLANSKKCYLSNCSVVNDTWARTSTAFEIFSCYTTLTDCYAYNVNTFMNVVPTSVEPGTFHIINNKAEKINNFICNWVYETTHVKYINASNNFVSFGTWSSTSRESFIHPEYGSDVRLSVDKVEIKNNTITSVIDSTDNVASNTYGDRLINSGYIKNFIMENNFIYNFRRGILGITNSGNELQTVSVKNNYIKDCCLNVKGTSVSESYQAAINFNVGSGYLTNTNNKIIEFSNNTIDMRTLNSAEYADTIGILLAIFHEGTDTKSKFYIIDNIIMVPNGHEIKCTANGATSNGLEPNGMYIKHHYTSPITTPYYDFIFRQGSIQNYMDGSEVSGSYEHGYVVMKKIGSDPQKYIVEGYNDAQPATGSFPKNAIIKNIDPAFTTDSPYAWVCTTSGTPGTWNKITTILN